jgi:hypothetical protein
MGNDNDSENGNLINGHVYQENIRYLHKKK